jgi:putative ATP-dependent endonuclease of the OLD family
LQKANVSKNAIQPSVRAKGDEGASLASTSAPPAPAKVSFQSGIFIQEVRVRHFRCLRSIDVELDALTILVGQNNSGKTSFLNAIFAAIGAGQRIISSDDIFLHQAEAAAPKERSIAIDILVRPTDGSGETTDVFPQGSPWLELWGNGVVQDDADRDLVAIRTSYAWSDVKGEYLLERRFLKDWQYEGQKWKDSKPIERVAPVSAQQIEPLAMYLLDAKRDIAEDLRSRSSFWSKMVEDHGLSQADVDRIEKELSDINKDIVESSDVFSHIQTHLKDFHETLSCDPDSIAITPLARHLRDLSRGMDVVLSTRGAPAFPLQQQGMGTRSLGTFFTFWAFTTWRQNQAKSNAVHPMMALEEPETHLHPQAQRALFRKISNMPGQRIVSTHSPYICGQAEIAHMRHFSKTGEETLVSRIDLGAGETRLTPEDFRKIDRQVMNTRGDMLFARALVFFEGETEEQALPDFAEQFWQKHPNDLGYSFIGVGGCGNYLPFLRMAESFRIPWFIFSDGEAAAVGAVNVALAAIGQPAIPNNPRVVVLQGSKDFEAYIVNSASKDKLIAAIVEHEAKSPQHQAALTADWALKKEPEQLASIENTIKANKTQYGALLGKVLPVPSELQRLFKNLDVASTPAKTKAEAP